jgi:hypothetical protein
MMMNQTVLQRIADAKRRGVTVPATKAEARELYYNEKARIRASNDVLVHAYGGNDLRRWEDEMFLIYPHLPEGTKPRIRVKAGRS